jgi:hypothetical protein
MTQGNLRDVIGLRMQLAREALDMAEEHRDEVWARIRSRIDGPEDGADPDAEAGRPTQSPRWDGPERRRGPAAEPMYASEEKPLRRRLGWPRFGLAYAAGAGLIAAAVGAAITLS